MAEAYKRKSGASAFERVMQRTKKTATCWLWKGYRQPSGHGQIGDYSLGKRATTACHRVAWRNSFGEIPNGLCVLHKCDVPNCVNPEHLFLGSRTDNAADKVKKGRVPKGTALPQAKLTEDDVRNLRVVYPKLGRGKTAALFGVSGQTAYEISSRRKWAWFE